MTGTKLRDGQSGPPTPESSDSYWHKEASAILLGHRTTDLLPVAADVVVVGSGITGAFAARELVKGGRGVLHLEAREACWGATGRNGGHCQPMVYMAKPSVSRFELGTYDFLQRFVAENSISCDWRDVGGVHALLDQETLAAAAEAIRRLKVHCPDLATKAVLVKDEETLAALRVPQAHGAVYQPCAAKLWPYKLVAWVLENLLSDHAADEYNLQTNTEVVRLQRIGDDGGDDHPWMVHTSRGQVAARHVLLACNGYTSYLLPEMTGIITPVRGQIAGLAPPADDVVLEHSHVWADQGGNDDYLIQREDDGTLILGGERFGAVGAEEGMWDDGVVNPDVGEKLRRALHGAVKLRAARLEEEVRLDARYEWTGIMGFAKDGYPWVGRVPASLGGGGEGHLWMSAGYTGHGMPTAARCGVWVARMIMGRQEGSFEIPREYEVHEARVERVAQMEEGVTSLGLADRLAKVLSEEW